MGSSGPRVLGGAVSTGHPVFCTCTSTRAAIFPPPPCPVHSLRTWNPSPARVWKGTPPTVEDRSSRPGDPEAFIGGLVGRIQTEAWRAKRAGEVAEYDAWQMAIDAVQVVAELIAAARNARSKP